MKLYTRAGDKGKTSLYSGERVSKSCTRVDAYGTIDELQASLGFARALAIHDRVTETLYSLQCSLVQVMTEIATADARQKILPEDVLEIEHFIDSYFSELPLGISFQIPGESAGSAALHVARTIARRAERILVSLAENENVNPHLLAYCNRISDLCFILARYEDEVKGE